MITLARPLLLARWWQRTHGFLKQDSKGSLLCGEGRHSPPHIEIPVELLPKSPSTRWITAAASVTGSSHAKRGLGCDDWFELRQCNGVLAIVAADGMGSARFGAVGARVATKAALLALNHENLSGATIAEVRRRIRGAVGAAQEAIGQATEQLACSSRELATTLIVVVAERDYIAIGHIGDGAVLVLTANGEAITAAAPQKGQYANETGSLGATDELLFTTVLNTPIRALAVMTDGLEHIAITQGSPYMPFMDPIWEFLLKEGPNLDEELAAFLQSERLQQATDDDATLVIAGPHTFEENN